MCYFIHGFVNADVDKETLSSIIKKHGSIFEPNLKNVEKIKGLGETTGFPYPGTNGCCDCGTSLGEGKADKEIEKYVSFFKDAQNCPKLKYLGIAKYWASDYEETAKNGEYQIERVPYNKIDGQFLAGMKENVIYKFIKYWDGKTYDTYEF